jgi:hypothetical protein
MATNNFSSSPSSASSLTPPKAGSSIKYSSTFISRLNSSVSSLTTTEKNHVDIHQLSRLRTSRSTQAPAGWLFLYR